jgi:PAS domain S-box-containing protein
VTARTLTLLAIDDSRDTLTSLQAAVSDRLPGARVLTAPDGPQGIELARAEDPDVILLDIAGAGRDGYAVCRHLKADERLQAIPVVFLTAPGTDPASRVAALDAGAEGFLPKPIDAAELVAQVRAMAKVKAASRHVGFETDKLAALVTQRTCQLAQELAERRKVEAELLASEAELRFVTDHLPAYFARIDDQRVCRFVNKPYAELFGLQQEEAVGKQVRAVLGEEAYAHARPYIDRVLAGQTVSYELDLPAAAGGARTVQVNYAPECDPSGRVTGFLAVIVDVTERKRIHGEKSRLEEQLRQSQKVEAIGRLAGGVAHDFNNLTAIVLGYGEMLLGKLEQEDPRRKWAEQIVAAGKRSAALTRQLLAFGRRQVLLPEVLDLNALLLNLEKMLGRALGEDVRLELKLAPDLGCITADPGQIEQVVTNLALNARDAMPLGGRLTVETTNVELEEALVLRGESVIPGSYVQLALTDSGCGMEPGIMDKVFEPFFTTKPKGKGTGLGLATVHGIVRQSGGYIFVSSVLGEGTTFRILLPLTQREPKGLAAEAGTAPPRGNGEIILLAEDEAPLRELCGTLLARLGYQVDVAGTGLEALHLVAQRRLEPDLLLTDVIMPDMGGAELAERLRRNHPPLGVLYMSGYPDEAIAPHGVVGPGTPLIQKPFTERALAEKVHAVLERRVAAAAVPAGRGVLMIDDDEQYRDLVRHFCTKGGHRFTGVDRASQALAELAAQPFDVLLVDMNIPGTSGERVLEEIRAAGHTTPAIVLTGDVASADPGALRRLGVAQTLEKSSSAEPLLRAIAGAGRG